MIAYNIQCHIIFIKTLIKQHLQFGQELHGLDQGTGNARKCEKAEVTVNYGLDYEMRRELHDPCS